MITTAQMTTYAKCLPVGDTQRRVMRGEEDANLVQIVDALTAVIEDRWARLGPPGRSFRDTSLYETIALCNSRLRHQEAA